MSDWKSRARPALPSEDQEEQQPSWKSRARVISPDSMTMPSSTSDWKSRARVVSSSTASTSEPQKQETEEGSPLIWSRPTTKVDVAAIAKKYNVNADDLFELVPYFGGTKGPQPDVASTVAETAKEALGFLGESVGLGLPQFLYKKFQNNPNMRLAIDELNDVIEKNESWGRAAAELGGGIGGGVAFGKLAGKVIQKVLPKATEKATTAYEVLGAGTAASAIAGLSTSKEGEEVQSATIGGVVGTVLPIAFQGLKKAIQTRAARQGQKELVRALENVQDNDIYGRALQYSNIEERDTILKMKGILSKPEAEADAITKEVFDHFAKQDAYGKDIDKIQKALDNETEAFYQYLQGKVSPNVKTAREYIHSLERQAGRGFVEKQFHNYRLAENAKRALNEKIVKPINEVNPDFIDNMKYFVSSARYVFRDIDRRLGSNSELIMDKMNRSYNEYQAKLANNVPTIKAVAKEVDELRKAGMTDEAIAQAIETGSSDKRIQNIAQAFSDLGTQAEQLGLPIKRVKDGRYIPHYTVDPVEATLRITRSMTKHADELEKLRGKSLNLNELSQDIKDLFNSVKILSGTDTINTVDDLFQAYTSIQKNARSGVIEELIAKSILARGNEPVPALIREYDPVKLMNRWNQSVFRYAYLREPLAEMKVIQKMADAAKDKRATEYLTKYLQDLSMGARQGTLAEAARRFGNEWRLKMLTKAAETTSSSQKAIYEFLAEMPGFGAGGLNNAYANFLGASPRALITNLTQPYLMTAPEIGYQRGIPAAIVGAANALKTWTQGQTLTIKSPELARKVGKQVGDSYTTRKLTDVLENESLIPKQWNTELRDVLKEGIASSKLGRMGQYAVDKATYIAMGLYQGTEVLNRYVAMQMADQLTEKILKGEANDFVAKLSPAYKRALTGADKERTQSLIRQYLIGKTIFDYNKISMSQYGRTMGPLFAMFTKWPTEIVGELIEAKENKQLMDKAAKYIAPWALLMALDQVSGEYDQRSRTEQIFIGRSGYQNMAPIGSVKGFVTGEAAFKQPAVTAVVDPVVALIDIQKDPEKFANVLNNLFMSFVPGTWVIRATEDIFDIDVPHVGRKLD